jgi:hypothetical protein
MDWRHSHGCHGTDMVFGLRSEITGGKTDGALANGGAFPSRSERTAQEGKGSYRLPDSLCNGCVGRNHRDDPCRMGGSSPSKGPEVPAEDFPTRGSLDLEVDDLESEWQ